MMAIQLDLVALIEAEWPRPVYLRRIDPDRNMRRFYALSIDRDLFGKVCLITEHGRIGSGGRVISRTFATEREAMALFDRTRLQKQRRGYAAAPSFHGA